MKRIYFLTELYYPEQTSTGYILTQIAEGLADEYDTKVITGPPTNFFQIQNYPNHEIRNNVEIFRCTGTQFNKNSIVGRLCNILTRSLMIFFKAIRQCKSSDIILVVTNPPVLPLLAFFVHKLKGSQFIVIVHDVYPDVLIVTKLYQFFPLIGFFWKRINHIIYTKAYRVIVIGRDMAQRVKSHLVTNDKKDENISCISNWAEVDTIKPISKYKNSLLQELNIIDKFIVLYTGNLGRTHAIENFVKIIDRLQPKDNIHFIVIGSGKKQTYLEQYIKSSKLQNITFIPLKNRPRSEQNISLNACDAAIIPFISGMAGISVPSRMYNHMAAGKPIIAVADDWSELAQVIQEENIGWVVKPGDVDSLVNTIEYAASHPELCQEMGAKAAEIARSKYTFEHTIKSYKTLIKELLATKNSGEN